jgi:hypothetical protein
MSEFHFQKVAKPELLPQRISIYDYFYVLMLMLYASRSNIYFESGSFTGNFIGVMLPVVLAGITGFKWKVIYTKQFYFIVLLFVLYFLAASIKYYIIQPTFLLTYLFLIFITYTTIKALKFEFFRIYEYLMFWLAIFSLFMWVMQLGLGGDTLYNMFARISLLQEISFVSGHGLSALFYSIQPFETTIINNFTIPRNCGYSWEPGSFAVYLCLALFINLFITSTRKDSKLRFWILFATLISTQSTTGYVIMMLIIVFYFINKDIKKILLVFPIVIAVMIFVSSLPFMKNKIFELIDETSRLEQLLFDSFGRENPVTPQRFTSLRITMVDFLHNPLLGLAAHYEDQWTYKLGSNISPISGIGNLFAQFGLFGVFFFLYFSIRSSFFLSRQMKYKGRWLLFLVIVFIAVSYSILFIPLVMCFWMFTLCEPEIAKEKVPGGILSKGENFSGELAV